MGILSTLKAKVDAHLDSQAEMVDAMGPDTVWASSAEIEYRNGRTARGLLWHDGRRARFRSWTTDYSWDVAIDAFTPKGSDIKVDDGETRCKVDDIRRLQDTLPFVEQFPACATLPETGRERVQSFFAAAAV